MPLRLRSGKTTIVHGITTDSEAFKKAIDMVPSLAKEAGCFIESTKLNKKIPTPKTDDGIVKEKTVENRYNEEQYLPFI